MPQRRLLELELPLWAAVLSALVVGRQVAQAPVAVGRVWAPIDLEEEEEAEGEAARRPMPHYEKCFQGL